MNFATPGIFIFVATSFAIAVASFYFIRRAWLAALVSLLVTPFAFAIVCVQFKVTNGMLKNDGLTDLTDLIVKDVPAVLLVWAVSVLIRFYKRRSLRTRRAAQVSPRAVPEPNISQPDSISMNQNIKIGNVVFKLQNENAPTIELGPNELAPKSQPVNTERPEMPEPLEEPQYIYRPNDAFQSSIDEAHAIASISASHRPWVKTTWFILFVIGPLVYAELFALATALRDSGTDAWKTFFLVNVVISPMWLIYLSIWRRKVRRTVKQGGHPVPTRDEC